MTDILPIDAVRASLPVDQTLPGGAAAPAPVASPSAVSRFQAAMAADAPSAVDPIPFVDAASATWRTAQVNQQGILHRIRALSAIGAEQTPAAADLLELQYEVANLAFQQEVVTKVADKTSSAIQTLVKNQ